MDSKLELFTGRTLDATTWKDQIRELDNFFDETPLCHLSCILPFGLGINKIDDYIYFVQMKTPNTLQSNFKFLIYPMTCNFILNFNRSVYLEQKLPKIFTPKINFLLYKIIYTTKKTLIRKYLPNLDNIEKEINRLGDMCNIFYYQNCEIIIVEDLNIDK